MTAPPAKPPPDLRGSTISSGDADSTPTSIDALRALPLPERSAPTSLADDGETLVDPKLRHGFLDLGPERSALDEPDFDARYELGEVVGRGGMGEVRLCADARIGRTVAIKLIRPDSARRPRLRARFLFEARMQGQLEHPSIVPVYDLGVRPDGSEFFTMRRVRGRTLSDILKDLRRGDRGTAVTFTRRRLLGAFQSVCLAIEFAHQRGVVHRDLKPANVMLGEFGEVIVLDWGLAKLRERDTTSTPDIGPGEAGPLSGDTTAAGEILGSPGYMSPEQAEGSQGVGPASDIFALGAVLFEILTLRHLVPGENNVEVTRNTVSGAYEARIAKRFPELDVAPELEAICVRATDRDMSKRHESARDLADAVERYLEGDRDVARRRAMAGRHTRAAITALAESADATDAADPEAARVARSRAIREVNHALAIDPQNQTALRTMMKIITETPVTVAPATQAAIHESETRALRTVARRGSYAYLALAANVAMLGLLGVQSWGLLAAACGCFLAVAAITGLAARPTARPPAGAVIVVVIALSSCGIAMSSMLFGPLVYVPSLSAANVVVFAAGVGRRYRHVALTFGLLAILVPLALELTGIVPAGWVFRGGEIVIRPRAVLFPEGTTLALLALASLGTVLFPVLLVGAERDARAKAERELLLRSQALAEFVPAEAGEALSGRRSLPPPPPSAPPASERPVAGGTRPA